VVLRGAEAPLFHGCAGFTNEVKVKSNIKGSVKSNVKVGG
jgi:hypothetical protein